MTSKGLTMPHENSPWKSKRFWSALAVSVSLILILLRIVPLGGPFIFADEYFYAAWASALYHGSHGVPPLDVALGNWLYLRTYSSVFVGVGSFLFKARVLNTIFSALAAGVLVRAFHLVEPTAEQPLPTALAVGFSVGLLGTYAGYFIPEAMYFAITCLWLYCTACYAQDRGLSLAILTGIVGGAATMAKGHGILLLPATFFVFVLIGTHSREGWRKTIVNSVALIVAWLICSAVISVVFRNDYDLNPVGGFYGTLASQLLGHTANYINSDFVELVLRYVATVLVILGLPLLICFWLAVTAVFRARHSGYRNALLFPALVLCSATVGLLFMSAVFTVAAVTPGSSIYDPYHSLQRLDGGRYYEDFALLAACVGIMGSRTALQRWSWHTRLVVLVFFLALLAAAWWVLRNVGWQNPNDFAIAFGLFASPIGLYFAVSLAVASALVVLVLPKRAPAVLAVALLTWLAFDVVRTEQQRWPREQPPASRVAAVVADAVESSSSIEIVGAGQTVPVYRAAFELLGRHVGFTLGAGAGACDVDGHVPDWVIIVDGMRNPCSFEVSDRIHIGDVAAARRGSGATSGAAAAVKTSSESSAYYRANVVLVGGPMVTANGRNILVTVSVTNHGPGTFGSATTPHNVNLGAHAIDASGKIVVNDLARGRLPQIALGVTERASILLPVKKVLGRSAELLPVEENVAWFDQWGTKPLVVGPFERCSNPTVGKVCDARGKPLSQVSAER